ncbi:hypothetical protein ACLOJK_028262 [Asimina triloba]
MCTEFQHIVGAPFRCSITLIRDDNNGCRPARLRKHQIWPIETMQKEGYDMLSPPPLMPIIIDHIFTVPAVGHYPHPTVGETIIGDAPDSGFEPLNGSTIRQGVRI